ncbi:hypothetical protein CRG98_048590, partial [Punica granatum]
MVVALANDVQYPEMRASFRRELIVQKRDGIGENGADGFLYPVWGRPFGDLCGRQDPHEGLP